MPRAGAAAALAGLTLAGVLQEGLAVQLSWWPFARKTSAAQAQVLRKDATTKATVTPRAASCPTPSGALTCPGFPDRKLVPISSLKANAGVLLSISAYEEPWYLRLTVENALRHTADSTVIVLHLNSNTSYPSVRENNSDFEWIWSQPRVEVNCIRWPARRWSGQLLHSQLANVRWARCRGLRSRVADVKECKRLALPEGGHGNFQACTPLKAVWSDRTSQATELLVNKTGTSEDRKSPVDPCYVPPFPGMRFIVQRKHEGSYYPTQDIYRMMDYLEEGLNNPELMAERINATMDSRCQVQGRRHTLLRPDLWSTEWPLEEVLPQSWVANFGLTNGTGDVMHKEFKWKRRLWSCDDIRPHLARPGVFAAKLHDLRDEGPTAEEHRILLATCSIPPP